MGFWRDLTAGVSSAMDDVVGRYNELRRLEVAGKLSDAGRSELLSIRHRLHFDE